MLADPPSLTSGWSGTLGPLSCWRAQPMVTLGCGRSQMVTVRPSRAPTALQPVAASSLMVRATVSSWGRGTSSDLEVLQSSSSPALYLVLPVTPGGIWEPPALSFLLLLSLVCLSALCPLVVCVLVLREESCRRV